MAQSKKNQIRIFPYLIFLLIKLPIPLFFFFKTKTSSLIRAYVDTSYRAIRNTAIVRKISAFFTSSSYVITAVRTLVGYTWNLMITFRTSDKRHCFTLSFLSLFNLKHSCSYWIPAREDALLSKNHWSWGSWYPYQRYSDRSFPYRYIPAETYL